MKKILGETKSIRELLSAAKYSIEYYQREYRWESKQIGELIDDLTSRFLEDFDQDHGRQEVETYGHYFLGSIIINHKDGIDFVVDGQQRLTSLSLLLIYLNHLQKAVAEEKRVKVDELIYSSQFGRKSFNISVEEREDCMDALFKTGEFDPEGQSEAVSNMVARYEDIEEIFPEELKGETLPYFVDWLIENVHLVKITAFSEHDAYTIFETMNDRGLQLSPIDMLKGYLLNNISDSGKRGSCNELWKKRVQQLSDLGKDMDADCFKSWLRSQHAITIRERRKDSEPGDYDRIGSEFHRWVRDLHGDLGLNSSEAFLNFVKRDFDFYSRRYLDIIHYGNELKPGFEHIFYNTQAGLTLQPMILLAPLKPNDSEAIIRTKWRLCAMYLDIMLTRRTWNYRSTDQSTMKYPMFKVMLAIRHLEPSSLAATLRQDLDSETETILTNDRFALHGMNRRQITRILARMTDYVETQSGLQSRYLEYTTGTGKKKYEVEHIWANKPERHQAEFQHAADFESYRNRLGGLLLLPKSFNASYNAATFESKLPHYFGQNVLAKSLHAECYTHHPGFVSFIRQSGLPFRAHSEFKKVDLDARNDLYRLLAEQIWNPSNLLREIGE